MGPAGTEAPPGSAEQATLAEALRKGDPAAEARLAQLFTPKIYVLALARTRDREAARDLVQEVLIAVLRALRNGQLREAEKLPAFIQGTARNLVNNYLRARCHQPDFVPILPDSALTAKPNSPQDSDRVELVLRALERLEVLDRKIMLMILVDGLKPGEIAYQLGLTSEAVRQRKSRAIKKVSQYIAKLSRT
jgi:RNA polymerase sigma factor (sigma-70 family)